MLFDIADGVGQGEAIVRRGIVDRCPRAPSVMRKQIGGPRKPGREIRTLACIAAPEPPDAVTESIIPFGEAGRMIAQLVAARADVPWFGDQLDL